MQVSKSRHLATLTTSKIEQEQSFCKLLKLNFKMPKLVFKKLKLVSKMQKLPSLAFPLHVLG